MKLAIFILTVFAAFVMIAGGGGKATFNKGDCAAVTTSSIRAYFHPEVPSQEIPSLVGRFTLSEKLKVIEVSGDWVLVNGQGIDSSFRKARLSGWVESSQLAYCQ
jgi:hypothetical protein